MISSILCEIISNKNVKSHPITRKFNRVRGSAGVIVCIRPRVSAHATLIQFMHVEGTSEVCEPTFSYLCPPLSPERMAIEVSVMSV